MASFWKKLGNGITSGITGLIGGALGIGSSIMSNKSNERAQDKANQTNLQIAQMNNEYNERMLQRQMDYNSDMWNKQNEYNSAQNQANRLRAAGLNPALVMSGSGSAGIATSASGVNTPNASPVQVNPAHYDYSGIGDSIRYALDYQLAQQKNSADIAQQNETTRGIQIENQFKRQKLIAEIYNMWEQSKKTKSERQFQQIMNAFQPDIIDSQLRETASRTNLNNQQIKNQVALEMLSYKELERFDEKSRLELTNLAQDIAVKVAQRGYLDKQTEHEAKKILDTMRTTEGKELDNSLKRDTYNYLVKKAESDTYPTSVVQGAYGVVDGLGKLGKRLVNLYKYGEFSLNPN